MPPGRTPIATKVVGPSRSTRSRMWKRLRDEVDGRAPGVRRVPAGRGEGQGRGQGRDRGVRTAAGGGARRACGSGCCTGSCRRRRRKPVMAAFRAGELDVLVATTVIEVGVDVANATVMIVEDADRFGLSQLHQLRGRVGRGADASWCFLVADPTTADGEARMEAIAASTDGFLLAEKDLEIRGAGEVFGERAVGDQRPQARPHPARRGDRDRGARAAAEEILDADPELAGARAAARGGRGPPRRRRRVPLQELMARAARGLRVIAGIASRGRAARSPRPATTCGRPRTSCARRCSPRSTPGARSPTRSCSTSTRARARSAIEALSRGAARAVLVERDRRGARGDRRERRARSARRPGPGRAARRRPRSSPARRPPRRRSTSCSPTRRTTPTDDDDRRARSRALGAPGGSRPARRDASSARVGSAIVRARTASEPAGSGHSAIRSSFFVDASDPPT